MASVRLLDAKVRICLGSSETPRIYRANGCGSGDDVDVHLTDRLHERQIYLREPVAGGTRSGDTWSGDV